MKKGNYNFPRIPPIPRIPWNRPGQFERNRKFEFQMFLFYCYCFECVRVKPQCFEVYIFSIWSFDIMASKRDMRLYFAKSDDAKKKIKEPKR